MTVDIQDSSADICDKASRLHISDDFSSILRMLAQRGSGERFVPLAVFCYSQTSDWQHVS